MRKKTASRLNHDSVAPFGSKGLKKVLGLPEVTFIAIGFMIGGGIFVFTGIVMVLFFGAVIFIDLKTLFGISGFFLFFISGAIYYVFRKRTLLKTGFDLNTLVGKEDWDA